MEEQCNNRRPGGPPVNPASLRNKAKLAGLAYHVVYQRVKLHGWPESVALSTPVQKPGRIAGRTNATGFKMDHSVVKDSLSDRSVGVNEMIEPTVGSADSSDNSLDNLKDKNETTN